jgi:hypothetical protein
MLNTTPKIFSLPRDSTVLAITSRLAFPDFTTKTIPSMCLARIAGSGV